MPYQAGDYMPGLLKSMSDLESTALKNAEAEARLREMEALVAELEENEKDWQEERKVLLRRIEERDEE